MTAPFTMEDTNLSRAWARTFLELMSRGGSTRHPALITINDLDGVNGIECADIRSRLDSELEIQGNKRCATVAGTLFPKSMWNIQSPDHAKLLYARYEKAWPEIAKYPANRNGVYFRRLTAFVSKDSDRVPVNQLQFIVDNYKHGNHRKSAMQASILDPTRDHTGNRQKGFPCLQQVSFTPLSNDRLSVTGYYATQYHFEKAYGNYLGLYWLGMFMAKQLGLTLSQVNCVAALLTLGDSSKSDLMKLQTDLHPLITTRLPPVTSTHGRK